MNSLTDQQLLRNYAERQSEAAFAELVRRHVDLVHSAALRMVCDAHLAEDVTQVAFVALAQNARELTHRPVLSGWLHRTAQNLATKVVRTEVRRRAREHEAATMNELLSAEADTTWKHIAPQLDAALGELSEPDRDALLLRYFERKSASEMAQTLGISDEAAQKRVNRAVERLREYFTKRGITVGASGLVVVISANAVQAAPAGLAATISSAAVLAGTAVTTTATATKAIAMTTLQKALVTIVLVGSVTTSLLLKLHDRARVTEAHEVLRQRAAQVLHLQEENKRLGSLAAFSSSPSANNPDELRKMREEVAGLRGQTNGLSALQKERWQLQYSLNKARQDSQDSNVQPSEWSEEAKAKAKYSDQLVRALWDYAAKHQNQFPTNFDDAAAFVSARTGKDARFTPDQFEIVYQGSTTALAKYANPALVLLICEKQPWKNTDGKWAKIYATGVGSEIISVADGKFDAFEKAHILPPES